MTLEEITVNQRFDLIEPFEGFGSETKIQGRLEIIECEEDITVKICQGNGELEESEVDKSFESIEPLEGFGSDTQIKGRLQIIDSEDITAVKYKRRGKPRGIDLKSKKIKESEQLILNEKRRPTRDGVRGKSFADEESVGETAVEQPSSVVSSPKFGGNGTSSRTKIFLLDIPASSEIGSAKLPKLLSVLKVFFHHLLEDPSLKDNKNPLTLATVNAANKTLTQLKQIWFHHFGMRLIFGKECEEETADLKKVMICSDLIIVNKILSFFKVK